MTRVLALQASIDGTQHALMLCTIDNVDGKLRLISATPFERETHSTITAKYLEACDGTILNLKYQ